MEANEFRIDKTKVLTKEYKLDYTNPGDAIEYTRNSLGTIMVDTNLTNIDSQRLVINLVNTRYQLLSFNNVLDTTFSEFLDPEITVPDEQQLNSATQNLSGTVLDLQNQLTTKDDIINNLQQTVDSLSNTLSSIPTPAAPQGIQEDNKKGRLWADGTLVRDRNNTAFYYIIEDGKKRFFQFDQEVLRAAAKAMGKVKGYEDTEQKIPIPDFVETTQDILDEIPQGAPFTAFDLVKDVKTPAPPPLDPSFMNGKRLIAKWFDVPNPLVIETENTTPTESELTKLLKLYVVSAEGIVNNVEVWEDGPWYDFKPQLPILDLIPGRSWNWSKITGFQDGVDSFKVMFKRTTNSATDKLSNSTGNMSGQSLLDAYQKIKLSIDNPEYRTRLAAKIANDVDDEYYQTPEDQLEVIIRYVPKMPNLISSTSDSARSALIDIGIPSQNIEVRTLGYTSTQSSRNKIYLSSPEAGAPITKDTQIILTKYNVNDTINFPTIFVYSFDNVVRTLKARGFTNIQINNIYRTTFVSQDLTVDAIVNSNNSNYIANTPVNYNAPIYLNVNLRDDGRLIFPYRNDSRPKEQLKQYLTNQIAIII